MTGLVRAAGSPRAFRRSYSATGHRRGGRANRRKSRHCGTPPGEGWTGSRRRRSARRSEERREGKSVDLGGRRIIKKKKKQKKKINKITRIKKYSITNNNKKLNTN